MLSPNFLSALGGAEAQSADIAAAAGRMDGDAAAMFAPPDKNDALLPATLAPCGGDRRCSGDGGGLPRQKRGAGCRGEAARGGKLL